MIRSLLHAVWHKTARLDGPSGAVIWYCSNRFWWITGRVTRCWFVPWPGAMPEKMKDSDELEARIITEKNRWS